MITAVLFDLDETLLDRTGSLRSFLASQHARHPALARTGAEGFVERFLVLDARGRTLKSAVYARLLAELGIADQGLAEALLDEYESCLWRFVRGFSGLDQLFKDLKQRGIRTAIVTNGQAHIQTLSIQALGLDRRANAVLISETERLRKPQPEMFLRALAKIGSRPAESVFVGDSPEADVLGARRAGLKTIWFANDAEWPVDVPDRADAEVQSLDQIVPLLDGLLH